MNARRIVRSNVFEALAVGVLLLFLEWTGIPDVPTPGIDPSWQAALHMAAHTDLRWGHDLLFTYGPLGWLRQPTYWFNDTGRVAIAYLVATRILWFAVLWLLARRLFGRRAAALVVLPVAWMIDDPIQVLGAAGALWFAGHQSELSLRAKTGLVALLGAGAGWELLGKVNVGVLVGAATVVAVALTVPRSQLIRLAASFTASFFAVLLLGWLGTGQSVGDLPDYLHGALQIVSGYSEAMGVEEPGLGWQYAVLGLIVVGGLLAAWRVTEGSARTRVGVAAVWAVVSFFTFKAGFVRHDYLHAIIPFATLGALALALPWRVDRAGRAVALVLVLASAGAILASDHEPDRSVLSLPSNAKLGVEQVSGIVRASRATRLRDQGTGDVQSADWISPPVVQSLQGQSVAVWPWEIAAVWAFHLDWKPLPVFQGYQAYSAPLDDKNADVLRGSGAPDRILLAANSSIDGRIVSLDNPATAREMLCRYRPQLVDGKWLVLQDADGSCAAPTRLRTQRVNWGEAIPVPQPPRDGIVSMVVHGAEPSGLEKLRTTLFRAHERYLATDGAYGRPRVPPGVLSAGVPLRVGADVDFPAPFSFGSDVKTVKIERAGTETGTDRPLSVEFVVERVAG